MSMQLVIHRVSPVLFVARNCERTLATPEALVKPVFPKANCSRLWCTASDGRWGVVGSAITE